MSKRKTRSQKVIAQLRRKLSTQDVLDNRPIQKEFYSLNTSSILPKTDTTLINQAHPYFNSDLRKTLLLTFTIIIVELILFFVLKK